MWYCAGADLARRQRGGDTQGVGGLGVGWTVELKLNRNKKKKKDSNGGGWRSDRLVPR